MAIHMALAHCLMSPEKCSTHAWLLISVEQKFNVSTFELTPMVKIRNVW